MSKIINDTRVVTNEIRTSYVHIVEPQAVKDGEPKYSLSVIIPKSDKETLSNIEKAIDAAITKGIGKFDGKRPNKGSLKLPLRDGDVERSDDEAYRDCYFINCNNKNAPQVVDLSGNPMDPAQIYSGCYCRISIEFYAFNAGVNRGIAAALGNIQFVRDGERLGGPRMTASDDFGAPVAADDFLS